MAKQLGEVRMITTGDETGPTKIKFEYFVSSTDDSSLIKRVSIDADIADFDVDTIKDFFDSYIVIIKAKENIS
jgi:hypothetical protein